MAAIVAVSTLLMPVQPSATHIEPSVEGQQIGPITLEQMIIEKARQNNLDEEKVIFIAKCESQIEPEALGDGHLICSSTGDPMRSRGIWQINECGHPEISDEQAFDPEWSTDWAIEIFKKSDEAKEWKRCALQYAKHLASVK